jgi:hypothetical protein
MNTNNSDSRIFKINDFVFAKESFISDYRGNTKNIIRGTIYKVVSTYDYEAAIFIKKLPANSHAEDIIYISWQDATKLSLLPPVSLDNITSDDDVLCVSSNKFDLGFNTYIEIGNSYSISSLNVRKNAISLREFPEQNRAEKVKWFYVDNFRVFNRFQLLSNISKVHFIPPLVEINGYDVTMSYYATTKFRSGRDIPIISNSEDWLQQCRKKRPAMCFYQNDTSKHALYNYYALLSNEGLAPEGYHIPYDDFFTDEIMSSINKLNLPKGIRKIGPDSWTGKYHDEFSEELIILTTMSFIIGAIGDDEYDDHCVCNTQKPPEASIYYNNGYWGYPILLVKGEPQPQIQQQDDDYFSF